MASSFGTKLYYSTDSGSTYVEAACVVDGNFPEAEKATYERKCLGQADRWIPKAGAFVNGGQATFRVAYAKAIFGTFMGMLPDEDPILWRVIIPDGANEAGSSKAEFSALLMKVGMPFPEDGGRLVFEITLDVSGAVVFTAGA